MIWLVVALVLLLSSPASAQAPVIAFVDLIEGPATGNSDTSQGQRANVNGTIVTLWGTNLGTSQGSSTVTVGGVPASAVYYWGNATPPNCGPAVAAAPERPVSEYERLCHGDGPTRGATAGGGC